MREKQKERGRKTEGWSRTRGLGRNEDSKDRKAAAKRQDRGMTAGRRRERKTGRMKDRREKEDEEQ